MNKYGTRKWWKVREGFLIAFNIAIGICLIVISPREIMGFLAGLNIASGICWMGNIRFRKRVERALYQDAVDVRTLSMICEKLTYDTLRQIDKAKMN